MSEINIKEIPNETLVQMYQQVKAMRAEISKQDVELKAKQNKIEVEFNDRCLEMNVDSFRAGGVNITRTIKRTPTVADELALLKWATENDRLDMVSIKSRSDPLKEYVSKHDELPEGMVYLDKFSISITKARK